MRLFNVLIHSVCGFSILLMLSVSIQWWKALPSPEFRWRVRGKPQVPINLPLPIQTPGQGTWLVSGAEVILTQPKQNIFVELPPEYYPLTVKLVIRNTKRKILHEQENVIEKYELPKPGKVMEVEFENDACFPMTLENYCSIQVKTKPSWNWHGKQVGFYLF